MTISRVGTCLDFVLKLLAIHGSRESDVALLESGFRRTVSIVEADERFHPDR